ncbi:MAG: FtsQ-type POTRA domain-containing protein [Negativicutes bacterium]|nr:FtsQ-type POTRA domain-containing protein [Negativicutes bacterium]
MKRLKPPQIGWKIRFLLLLPLLLLLSLLLLPIFRLSELTIIGNVKADINEIYYVLGEPVGKPLLLLRLQPLQAKLVKTPWIARAQIRYLLPNKMQITLTERQIMAYIPYHGNYLAISDEGIALEIATQLPANEQAILLTGIELPFLGVGDRIPAEPDINRVKLLIGQMSDTFKKMVAEIKLTDARYLTIVSVDNYRIQVQGNEVSSEQLDNLRTIILLLREKNQLGTIILQEGKPVFIPD